MMQAKDFKEKWMHVAVDGWNNRLALLSVRQYHRPEASLVSCIFARFGRHTHRGRRFDVSLTLGAFCLTEPLYSRPRRTLVRTVAHWLPARC